ncbi:zinc-dependent metalloprotease [Sediminitomix flava]|uniref:Uncharacterized protein DUF5117 n=1 Tax=Sediminitomix flava TaxID=379075 RepID=A0A315ZFM4_SEDFL|nr:zinc-dependent metalloprotease [Sediminitomix flava]PWJ43963.1 uncharacterized protein DUF5117 [Sediminitomix flava]
MKPILTMIALSSCMFVHGLTNDAFAQKKRKKGKTENTEKPKPEKKKYIKDMVKDHVKEDGLFTFYQDQEKGEVFLQVDKTQLDKEFIYFSYVENGNANVSGRLIRGSYQDSEVFTLRKHFNKIELVKENHSFYFDENNPISKSADANVMPSILASMEIKGYSEDSTQYLLKANDFLLSETLTQLSFSSPSGRPRFSEGKLSKSKSKYLNIKSYPQNSDVVVEYVFENARPKVYGDESVTDARNTSVILQHSFIEMPENDFEPRFDDPRIGYFNTQVTDMTATNATPYRDLIHRWDLQKKDPSAEISEPEKPIVWWIENTTPLEWRETIKEAVLKWNIAFEKAGFKNAMQVKVQPDDAEWDAGDIRYNVLRWTSSPKPAFGGYGPSFANPRTGEILGADIMLEYVHFTNRVAYTELLGVQGESHLELFSENELHSVNDAHNHEHTHGKYFCSYGHELHNNMMFGQIAESLLDEEVEEENALILTKLKKEAMMELIMHEVGHTLGLNHNMKASQLYSPEQLHDMSLTSETGLTGSVMDYVQININSDRANQGHYYSTSVGPYDLWAIEYGYKPVSDKSELDAITARSSEPALMFGNDADDMRSPGRGIDPRVMIGDISNDAISYSTERMKFSEEMMQNLLEKYSKKGESYQSLKDAYNILLRQYSTSAGVISRYIGGIKVERGFAGEDGATQPYTPISVADQKRAMASLERYVFSPSAFNLPSDTFAYLQSQRRGFSHWGNNEDPKIHQQILSIQKNVMRHLLHPNTVQRIIDSELYGNEYDLATYMTELNDAIIKKDIRSNVSVARQNLQTVYVNQLIKMIEKSDNNPYMYSARAMALYNLKKIRTQVQVPSGNVLSRAHKEQLKMSIDKALSVN